MELPGILVRVAAKQVLLPTEDDEDDEEFKEDFKGFGSQKLPLSCSILAFCPFSPLHYVLG